METKFGKSVLCLAMLGAVSSMCYAQSSVTLYGVLDNSVMYQSNVKGGTRVSLDALTGLYGSRWGMTGVEDLGGGLRAIFTLESGINLNNGQFGQGGTAFGRQAFVGLSSDRMGSLTFGRQYDMIFYYPLPLTPGTLVGGPAPVHPGDVDNAANSIRINNSIRYMSPSFHGLTFGGEYSVGGIAGNVTANSGYSVGTAYAYGPFKIGAAFEYFKDPTSSTPGSGFFTAYANGVSTLSQSLNKGYVSAQAYQSAVLAANYTIGKLVLATSLSNAQYANLGTAFANGTARFNNVDVGATYLITPFLFVGGSYDYMTSKGVRTSDGQTVGNQHYHQLALLTDYLFSKRTDVWFTVGWQHASGTSSIGSPAVADIDSLGDSSNNHQLLLRLGLKHKF
ncbi:porin [Caballeronia novacaledonica]|uniref:Porin n=1 Tax=Caballeronia novacaledonica TaxID=1544861 RepID=A0AA37MK56_9BURK|nr:porin [Caballeronia novacaledonica]GJH31020.1 porin [Caballeronia novacaledonica]